MRGESQEMLAARAARYRMRGMIAASFGDSVSADELFVYANVLDVYIALEKRLRHK